MVIPAWKTSLESPLTPKEAFGLNALMVTEPLLPSTPQLATSKPCWSINLSARPIKRSWEMRSVAFLENPTIRLVVGDKIIVISFNCVAIAFFIVLMNFALVSVLKRVSNFLAKVWDIPIIFISPLKASVVISRRLPWYSIVLSSIRSMSRIATVLRIDCELRVSALRF